jgi:hypothetical protein
MKNPVFSHQLLKAIQPVNKWQLTPNSRNIIDQSTGDKYWHDDEVVSRFKLFLLTLGTCTINVIAAALHSVYYLAKIVTCYELIKNSTASWQEAMTNYAKDVARVLLAPVILIGLEITAILGIITPMKNGPQDAKKMYALGETLLFGFDGWRLAPCFRPSPERHFFGGTPEQRNAF